MQFRETTLFDSKAKITVFWNFLEWSGPLLALKLPAAEWRKKIQKNFEGIVEPLCHVHRTISDVMSGTRNLSFGFWNLYRVIDNRMFSPFLELISGTHKPNFRVHIPSLESYGLQVFHTKFMPDWKWWLWWDWVELFRYLDDPIETCFKILFYRLFSSSKPKNLKRTWNHFSKLAVGILTSLVYQISIKFHIVSRVHRRFSTSLH